MHDVRVPLDLHDVRELDRAVIGDPADIVATQVHEHDVLGPLLGIGEQFLGQRAILGLGAASPAGPRQRPDRHERPPRPAPGSRASCRSARNRRTGDRTGTGWD